MRARQRDGILRQVFALGLLVAAWSLDVILSPDLRVPGIHARHNIRRHFRDPCFSNPRMAGDRAVGVDLLLCVLSSRGRGSLGLYLRFGRGVSTFRAMLRQTSFECPIEDKKPHKCGDGKKRDQRVAKVFFDHDRELMVTNQKIDFWKIRGFSEADSLPEVGAGTIWASDCPKEQQTGCSCE